MKKLSVGILIIVNSFSAFAQRETLSLNGEWAIEESVDSLRIPKKYTHTVQVPGLANMSVPEFKDIDKFYGKEYLLNSWAKSSHQHLNVNADTLTTGLSVQERNYLWYKKVVDLKTVNELYVLKINKAQFGTRLIINGKTAGYSTDCFSSQYFNITRFLKVPGKNEIVIRIGAHPGVLPAEVPAGNDYEKRHWTPGIYDDVSLICTNYPYIESVQVSPDIYNDEVTVQSVVIARPGTDSLTISYKISEWKSSAEVANFISENIKISGGSEGNRITHKVKIPDPKLWSCESPFLYVLDVSTGNDNFTTRFGMREFRFDTPTKRAWLNGKIIYLRGSNITLHRFFDDSLCRNHPWDEKWVRKLLTDLPAKYSWNSFRFCIGPVPDKWFDIADENGLIIQNEYFIWSYRPYWDTKILQTQLEGWMRDSWNHPSVGWWDINNETRSDTLTKLIPLLRGLDLSDRAWDNGYNLPVGSNDPVEDHNYKWFRNPSDTRKYFEEGTSAKTTNSPHPTAHAAVLNEYGWMWLKRSGEVTLLTKGIYDSIAPDCSNSERQEIYAYLLAAETEYFRAHRNYAGVLHFDYLTGDFNGAITGDIFRNPETLEPLPAYDKYFSEIFKPLGVYVNFFQPEVNPASRISVPVMLINDEYKTLRGTIEMNVVDSNGKSVFISTVHFTIDPLSQQTYILNIAFPEIEGEYILKAKAIQDNGKSTTCVRKTRI